MPAPREHPIREQDAGFTLIEVLVAFIIAMLALAVVYEGMQGGIEATQVANRTEEALSRARSHLAAVGHGMRIVPLAQDGDDGSGFRWQIRIVPELAATSGLAPSMVLYQVQVTESWPDTASAGGRRSLVLRTRRLGMKERTP
jgi:general secretion pathway protein I